MYGLHVCWYIWTADDNLFSLPRPAPPRPPEIISPNIVIHLSNLCKSDINLFESTPSVESIGKTFYVIGIVSTFIFIYVILCIHVQNVYSQNNANMGEKKKIYHFSYEVVLVCLLLLIGNANLRLCLLMFYWMKWAFGMWIVSISWNCIIYFFPPHFSIQSFCICSPFFIIILLSSQRWLMATFQIENKETTVYRPFALFTLQWRLNTEKKKNCGKYLVFAENWLKK